MAIYDYYCTNWMRWPAPTHDIKRTTLA